MERKNDRILRNLLKGFKKLLEFLLYSGKLTDYVWELVKIIENKFLFNFELMWLEFCKNKLTFCHSIRLKTLSTTSSFWWNKYQIISLNPTGSSYLAILHKIYAKFLLNQQSLVSKYSFSQLLIIHFLIIQSSIHPSSK